MLYTIYLGSKKNLFNDKCRAISRKERQAKNLLFSYNHNCSHLTSSIVISLELQVRLEHLREVHRLRRLKSVELVRTSQQNLFAALPYRFICSYLWEPFIFKINVGYTVFVPTYNVPMTLSIYLHGFH